MSLFRILRDRGRGLVELGEFRPFPQEAAVLLWTAGDVEIRRPWWYLRYVDTGTGRRGSVGSKDPGVRAEFTVYPFIEGMDPPPHVRAAIGAVKASGLDVDVGPLSNTVVGQLDRVLEALASAQTAAISAGASRFVLSLEPRSSS